MDVLRHSTQLAFFLLFVLKTSTASAQTLEGVWPQWQGPDRTGVSQETGLLEEWPEEGPQQVWLTRDCGLGYGGPAIVGDRLYILGTRDNEETLFSIDTATGNQVWSKPLSGIYENDWGNGPRSTPTVEGERIYAMTGTGTLACVDTASGEIVWSRTMQEMGGSIPQWGYCESPLIVGERLYCTPGGKQGTIAVLDKLTGATLAQSGEVTDGAQYSSIVTIKRGDRLEGVQLLEKQFIGFRLEDAGLLWSVPFPGRVAVIPTPIVRGNEVYATAGYGAGCVKVRIGDDNQVEKLYDNKVMVNHHGGVVLVGDTLYGYSDGKGWTCQNFETGERVWMERSAQGKGSVAYADGRLYCYSEDTGEVVLAAASPDGWQEHGRFTLEPQTELRKPQGKIWTHPVVADGRLYLRDQDVFVAYDVKSP